VIASQRLISHDADIHNPSKNVEEQKRKIEEEIHRSIKGKQIGKIRSNINTGKTVSSIPEFEGWDEKLATESEAVVKAERSEEAKEDISILQKVSVETLEKEEAANQNVSK
jgi:hypothetical protein